MNNTEAVIITDLNKICRICLSESESLKSVFSRLDSAEIFEDGVSTLAEILARITLVKIEKADNFPLQVCSPCVGLIHSAYIFKIKYEQSYNILQEYISTFENEALDKILDNDASGSDDPHAADNYIETVEQVPRGRRQTSRKQILKRSGRLKFNSKRGRRAASKITSDEENDDTAEADSGSICKEKLHPCPICTKEFEALALREHAQTHKALKKYLSIPNAYKVKPTVQFYHKNDPYNEIVSIYNRDVKTHKCVLCDVELPALEFRAHLEDHRTQTEYKCDQCERVFRKINHLNTHRVKHLKEFPFKCEHCSKGFVIKKNYDCHVLTHNMNQELPHECTHCLRRFSNPEHLNRHIIVHTENMTYSVKYRVCKCHHCLKTFKDRDELKQHQCIPIEHVSNTRFPCSICNKIFKNSSGLYNHKRNIHKLKGAKVLCSVCGNYVSNIYNHMMRHTGEKPYQCNQCGKRFVGKPQLRQHLLVHSGLKPFVCSVCAKAFNNLYNLQVHERIHKGDRCHICNICNKGFLEKSYLKKHMNVHRKI